MGFASRAISVSVSPPFSILSCNWWMMYVIIGLQLEITPKITQDLTVKFGGLMLIESPVSSKSCVLMSTKPPFQKPWSRSIRMCGSEIRCFKSFLSIRLSYSSRWVVGARGRLSLVTAVGSSKPVYIFLLVFRLTEVTYIRETIKFDQRDENTR